MKLEIFLFSLKTLSCEILQSLVCRCFYLSQVLSNIGFWYLSKASSFSWELKIFEMESLFPCFKLSCCRRWLTPSISSASCLYSNLSSTGCIWCSMCLIKFKKTYCLAQSPWTALSICQTSCMLFQGQRLFFFWGYSLGFRRSLCSSVHQSHLLISLGLGLSQSPCLQVAAPSEDRLLLTKDCIHYQSFEPISDPCRGYGIFSQCHFCLCPRASLYLLRP